MRHLYKIFDLPDLAATMASLRSAGASTALAHGCFDILHLGHVRHLGRARELCDFLAVTVTPDRFVGKGPHRPVFTAAQRAEVLAALAVVDAVAVNMWPTAVQTIRLLAPVIYVKGAEYEKLAEDQTTDMAAETAACEEAGGRVEYIDEVVFSSSSLAQLFYAPLVGG
jgi:rfaE bifunctional protein nucleotidyltransferase chain/domain